MTSWSRRFNGWLTRETYLLHEQGLKNSIMLKNSESYYKMNTACSDIWIKLFILTQYFGVLTSHLATFPPGVKDCLRCPAGFYCPEGTSDPVPCPPGTFNPLEGQDELADCRECYAGKACTQVALRAPDVDCIQGWVTSVDPLQKPASALIYLTSL